MVSFLGGAKAAVSRLPLCFKNRRNAGLITACASFCAKNFHRTLFYHKRRLFALRKGPKNAIPIKNLPITGEDANKSFQLLLNKLLFESPWHILGQENLVCAEACRKKINISCLTAAFLQQKRSGRSAARQNTVTSFFVLLMPRDRRSSERGCPPGCRRSSTGTTHRWTACAARRRAAPNPLRRNGCTG